MKDSLIIFFMACIIILLSSIIFYQKFVFKKGIKSELEKVCQKLSDILEKGTDEKVMVFTDNKIIMDLKMQEYLEKEKIYKY